MLKAEVVQNICVAL